MDYEKLNQTMKESEVTAGEKRFNNTSMGFSRNMTARDIDTEASVDLDPLSRK